jgi:hypothetical protein
VYENHRGPGGVVAEHGGPSKLIAGVYEKLFIHRLHDELERFTTPDGKADTEVTPEAMPNGLARYIRRAVRPGLSELPPGSLTPVVVGGHPCPELSRTDKRGLRMGSGERGNK